MFKQHQQPFTESILKATREIYKTQVEPILEEILKKLEFKIVNSEINPIDPDDDYVCFIKVYALKPELPPNFSAKLNLVFLFFEPKADKTSPKISDLFIEATYINKKQFTYYEQCTLFDSNASGSINNIWYKEEDLKIGLDNFLNNLIAYNHPDVAQKRNDLYTEIKQLEDLIDNTMVKKNKLRKELQKLKIIENF